MSKNETYSDKNNLEKLKFNINELLSNTASHENNQLLDKNLEIGKLQNFYKERQEKSLNSQLVTEDSIQQFLLNLRNSNLQISKEQILQINKALKTTLFNPLSIAIALCPLLYALKLWQFLTLTNPTETISTFTIVSAWIGYFIFACAIFFFIPKISSKRNAKKALSLAQQHNVSELTVGMFLYHQLKSDNLEFNNYILKEFNSSEYNKKIYELSPTNIHEIFSDDFLNQIINSLISQYKNRDNDLPKKPEPPENTFIK